MVRSSACMYIYAQRYSNACIQCTYVPLVYMYVHESSVGPSSTTNPKPTCRGKPSHCLLRQTYMYMSTQQKAEPLGCLHVALRTRASQDHVCVQLQCHTLQCTRTSLYRPSEVECVSGLPHFLATPPPSREPFYRNDCEVVSPKIRSGEGGGTLVYSNQTTKHKYVCNIHNACLLVH